MTARNEGLAQDTCVTRGDMQLDAAKRRRTVSPTTARTTVVTTSSRTTRLPRDAGTAATWSPSKAAGIASAHEQIPPLQVRYNRSFVLHLLRLVGSRFACGEHHFLVAHSCDELASISLHTDRNGLPGRWARSAEVRAFANKLRRHGGRAGSQHLVL